MHSNEGPHQADSPYAEPGFCGGEADLDTLVEQLQSTKKLTRQHGRESLVALGSCAIPALTGLLDSSVAQVRWESAKALGEIAWSEAAPGLVKVLDDADHGVRWVAATGLINVGPSSLPSILQKLMDDPGSKGLRDPAHDVLKVLSKRYKELKGILAPVMEVLGELDPAGAIPPRALRALEQLEALGPLEALESPPEVPPELQ